MYKQFTSENKITREYKSHKSFTLTESDLTRRQFLSASSNNISKSYYDFARINFYLSGSHISEPELSNSLTIGRNGTGEHHLNKFYSTGSILFLSQSNFDEGVKRGSFVLTDRSTSANIRIVDDNKGNLYSTNATFSQSVSALSSSDNYVGNIFYDVGVCTITETASFDGTNNYVDVLSDDYTLEYKGTKTINTYEWVCEALPNEFNNSSNFTVYNSNGSGSLKSNLTGSSATVYISEVGLYDDNKSLVGYARLSKPIPKSNKIPMKFFVRMDY